MSFGSPLALLGLAVLPVLALLYVGAQRQRDAAAAAFAAPGLQRNVAPQRPGWRRHAPMAIFALALLALVLAAGIAEPEIAAAILLQIESDREPPFTGSVGAAGDEAVGPTEALSAPRAQAREERV